MYTGIFFTLFNLNGIIGNALMLVLVQFKLSMVLMIWILTGIGGILTNINGVSWVMASNGYWTFLTLIDNFTSVQGFLLIMNSNCY
jgi:hypothetical protein